MPVQSAVTEVGPATENFPMPNGTWVLAGDRTFRLYRPARSTAPRFSKHLFEAGNARHTRQLLAGALLAGVRSRASPGTEAKEAAPSLERHIHSLASNYQTTHATPPTMREVAARFRAEGKARMADYCLHVAEEETGHDRLALKDLEALGIRSMDFVENVRPANACRLVALFREMAAGVAPVSVLGYAYALERFALFQTREAVAAVEAVIPAGTMATRCLRVHSAASTDDRHVAESLDFIAGLGADDRIHIARAVFESAACMTAPTDYPGDEAMRDIIAAYRH